MDADSRIAGFTFCPFSAFKTEAASYVTVNICCDTSCLSCWTLQTPTRSDRPELSGRYSYGTLEEQNAPTVEPRGDSAVWDSEGTVEPERKDCKRRSKPRFRTAST